MSGRGNRFEWAGGHPALDFVNTLDERSFDEPIENLATYQDLVRFAELAGLIDRSVAAGLRGLNAPACSRVATRARELREHLHNALAAAHRRLPVSQIDLDAMASAVETAHAARVLVASSSGNLASYRWSHPRSIQTPLHACALAIEGLLMNVDARRIKKCGASDCNVYFVDRSKGQRRQWCSMNNCGNREKQRRWRAGAT